MAAREATGSDDAITGINITPLVDVVLVLLVVLMVTAGYVARRTLPIELPTVRHDASAATVTLDIVVGADGRASIDGVLLGDEALRGRIHSLLDASPGSAVHASVSADRS